jgi:hypothetical protein
MAAAASVSSTCAPDIGRFAPGAILVQRYRVVGAIGRGGMGEVYRAFDMVLGQEVALKFLPENLHPTGAVLERFRTEVRLARQVSHSNVCRVYDIGEADGAPFLSMEYVDGEDLASLLRRIGRLPADKALDISRRLCAGLAAAHEKGVLHRDLKPGNIMLDGRGEVRITDFGLAAIAGSVTGEAARQGTPAYMAPEQLAGQEVTTKSDLYALGLVLYEMFTGRRAFEAQSLPELVRLQRESAPASIETVAKDVDPAVERVILRCLAPNSKHRPASAKAVALALPGGDPLAAAIAAGETPSPEMVANAEDGERVKRDVLIAWFAAAIVGVVLIAALGRQAGIATRAPLENSPESLATMARDHARRLGYAERGGESAMMLESNTDYVRYAWRHIGAKRFEQYLAAGRPAAITFWYRQSPWLLYPAHSEGRVGIDNPPMDRAGMCLVRLDPLGRLLEFEVVPRERERGPAPSAPMDWKPLFEAASLDSAQFRTAEPEWTPAMAFDIRAAWAGTWPDVPDIPIRLEAASWRGKVVSFRVIEPWTAARRDTGPSPDASGLLFSVLTFVIAAPAAAYVAWRNWRARRGDVPGAVRVGAAVMLLNFTTNTLIMTHTAGAPEVGHMIFNLALSMNLGILLGFVTYLAIEPYVRRRHPQLLITWTRLLRGDWRDPMLATAVLIGASCGILNRAFQAGVELLKKAAGEPPYMPTFEGWSTLLGVREFLSHIPSVMTIALYVTLLMVFLFCALRMVLRHDLAAGAAVALIVAIPFLLGESPLGIATILIFEFAWVYLNLRHGVAAGIAFATTSVHAQGFPLLNLDPSRWYFNYWLLHLVMLLGFAAVAFRLAMGKRQLIGDESKG